MMGLIGQRSALSTALPRNKNLLQTCWMNCLPCCLVGVLSIPVLRIVFWCCTELGCTGMVYIGVLGKCVGIVLAFLSRTLALTSGPCVSCSSSLT